MKMQIHVNKIGMIKLIMLSMFFSLFFVSCQFENEARLLTPVPSLSPSISTPDLKGFDQKTDFKIVKIEEPIISSPDIIVNSPNGKIKAFSTCDKSCDIFIENDSVIYHFVFPSFLSWRPFINLRWQSDDVLVFDQLTQPHYAIHYVVNIASQELVEIYPINNVP
jgi:hypothetical protein